MVKFESLKSDILDRIPAATSVLNSRSCVVFAYSKLSLFGELTDALETSELDLVVLNTAPISLTGRILSHKKNLVDKDPFLRHRYESQTLRQYFDFHQMEVDFFDRRFGDADCFLVLREHGVISRALAPHLVQMAKFRNVVVHQYDEVDAEIVVSILRKDLEVFTDFRNQILSHLKSKKQ
jgi:uncharacterized protein YutE (UPF0331/DUF86 family)